MITIIICALLGCAIYYFTNKGLILDWFEYIPFSMISLLLGSIISIFIGVFADIYEESKFKDIITISDNSTVEGSFFLGCGNVSGEMRYSFYMDNRDSTYSLMSVRCSDSSIKYTDGKPRFEVLRETFDNTFIDYFGIVFIGSRYIFHVPKGSITNDFNLDAQ